LFFEFASPTDRIQGCLLTLAGVFLFLFAASLSLSPAVREQSWEVSYRWMHWLGLLLWVIMFAAAHVETSRRLPDRDPYLLPTGALLSGWGLLTIWRLLPAFGQRQALWLLIVLALFIFALRLPSDLSILRRYKYLWLTGGLILTALTFVLGTNPTNPGFSRLWLGGPDIYLQPSEPLKLFLVIYLAGYLAPGNGKKASSVLLISSSLLPLLAPTLIMTGLALLLLFFQRDLGTAAVFLFIYASTVYLASGRKAILFFAGAAFSLSAAAGYFLFDVLRIRIEAWLNPWLDPTGRSFQIVQSLLAAANGGLFGRGPGLGSPGLVPVPHSDFIYTSILEETGLIGGIALLAALALLCGRGLHAALSAPDAYRRYLAGGITAYLSAQAILIIGGNLRLLPLTGVTLPFVSYGGSSLLTSFVALVLLMHVSNLGDAEPQVVDNPAPYLYLGGLLFSGIFATALITGWWTVVRGPDLLTRPDNLRQTLADRFVRRGDILDRNNQVLVRSTGQPGNLERTHYYPFLSLVNGYTHPVYGQSGLEASLNPFLRGLEGYPDMVIWWEHLIQGQPPPGLDVRLTIDLDLQIYAHELFSGRQGALVVLNAETGDLLALVANPYFDPNNLNALPALINDLNAPLLNRASQGLYQPGTALAPLFLAANLDPELSSGRLPILPENLSYQFEEGTSPLILNCAVAPSGSSWGAVTMAGCPRTAIMLGQAIQEEGSGETLNQLLQTWGFYSPPSIRLPAASSSPGQALSDLRQFILGQGNLRISPLQLALAVSSLSAEGIRPAPRLAQAYLTPLSSWETLPRLEESRRLFQANAANNASQALSDDNGQTWYSTAAALNGADRYATWFAGGTGSNWRGAPVAVVVLIEEHNPAAALQIGRSLLHLVTQP
jgi:cell division protein FtsW (lipid II flippase)